MSNRENFKDKTKRTAAEKVGYFCSNPNCRRFTIGPGSNGKSHRYGEAAHIYAASGMGPRGNESISKDELISEKNCLWLCNNCHELIDSNPDRYSPELLKEWKRTAEERAFEIVSNPERARKVMDEIERKNGLSDYFNELFYKGDFRKVLAAIFELNNRGELRDEDKDELCFAQVRYNAFCARKNLKECLPLIMATSQNIKERFTDFAIECFDEDLCEVAKTLSNNDRKRIFAQMISENHTIEEIIQWADTNFTNIDNKHLIDTAKIIGCVKSGKTLIGKNNKRISLRGGWLLDTFDTVSSFIYEMMFGRKAQSNTLQFFLDRTDIYTCLDKKYVHFIFDYNFKYYPSGNLLEDLMLELIDNGASTSDLRLNYFFAALPQEKRDMSMDKAIQLGIKYNDNKLLSHALFFVGLKNPRKTINFIEANYHYVCEDLLFFDPYCMAKDKLHESFDKMDFLLNHYIGEKDSTYNLICAHSSFAVDDKESFEKYWKRYKENHNDYNNIYIIMALEIAFSNNDTAFIKSFCAESMNVAALIYAAQGIINKNCGADLVCIILKRMESVIGSRPSNYYKIMFNLYVMSQNYNKAIEVGVKSYFEENDENIAPYVIQLMIDLAIFEECDFIYDVQKKSNDPIALNILGQFYLKCGKTRKGYEFIARSVSVKNDSNDLKFLGLFVECELLNEIPESNDYSYIITDQNKSFLLLPATEKRYFGNSLFGTSVFFTDEATDLCLLRKGDFFTLNGKKMSVKEVHDYFFFFHKLAIERLIEDPSSIAIKGNSVEEAISQITKIIKDADIRTKEFLSSTNDKPLPFFILKNALGKSIIETIITLYFSDERKNFFVPVERSAKEIVDLSNGVLFDTEMIYLAYKMGIPPEVIKNNKCKIASLTKGALLNEISEKEKSYKGIREKGMLGINKNNKAEFFGITNDVRRNSLKEVYDFRVFIENFKVVATNNGTYTNDQATILNFFSEEKDYVDAEVLKCLWNGETLISNNLMFHMAQRFGNGDIFDISKFLSICSCSVIEAINAVKFLKQTNIQQYLTPDVFDSIMNKISNINDKNEKDNATNAMVELIKGNWSANWTKEEIKKHKEIVYLASFNERDNLNQHDVIHVALKEIFYEIVVSFIHSVPFVEK